MSSSWCGAGPATPSTTDLQGSTIYTPREHAVLWKVARQLPGRWELRIVIEINGPQEHRRGRLDFASAEPDRIR